MCSKGLFSNEISHVDRFGGFSDSLNGSHMMHLSSWRKRTPHTGHQTLAGAVFKLLERPFWISFPSSSFHLFTTTIIFCSPSNISICALLPNSQPDLVVQKVRTWLNYYGPNPLEQSTDSLLPLLVFPPPDEFQSPHEFQSPRLAASRQDHVVPVSDNPETHPISYPILPMS